MKLSANWGFGLALVMTLAGQGCNKDKDPHAELKAEVVANYADLAYQTYHDALHTAEELHLAISDFVASPTQIGLENAKQAWLAAREPYGQTEVFRFGDGPIDDANGPEGLLNAWPLDEGYIDYVVGVPNSGLVNNTAFALTKANLESMNENGGEENISVGYHAIEFLLWGQDDPDVSLQTPGNRPYTDYLLTGGTASNADRRGQYLLICTELLQEHLQTLVDAWSPGQTGNYRATFLALDKDEALRKIMTGMGILSKAELAGERMFTALDNQDQEDEHSCFSDNTHRDIVNNALGILNVYYGTYQGVAGNNIAGTSLKELAKAFSADSEAALTALLEEARTSVNAIPAPFDYSLTQESVGGTGPIMQAIRKLQSSGDQLAVVANTMDIKISTVLPE